MKGNSLKSGRERVWRKTYQAELFPIDFQSSARLLVAKVFASVLIEQVDVLLANMPANNQTQIDFFLGFSTAIVEL